LRAIKELSARNRVGFGVVSFGENARLTTSERSAGEIATEFFQGHSIVAKNKAGLKSAAGGNVALVKDALH